LTRLSKEPTEKEIQNSILAYLNKLHGCKAWTNNTVGIYDAKRGIFRKNRSPYTSKGSSDIIGIFKGYVLCLEVKSKKGKLTFEQKAFLEEMAQLGALCGVVRSLDQAVKLMTLFEAHIHDSCTQDDTIRIVSS